MNILVKQFVPELVCRVKSPLECKKLSAARLLIRCKLNIASDAKLLTAAHKASYYSRVGAARTNWMRRLNFIGQMFYRSIRRTRKR